MTGKLRLKDGTIIEGESFGASLSVSGEVVFATGMVGYPESFTDPSYAGQILVLTFPLIGNYGVPDKKYWESPKLQISGLVVSDYINTPSHHQNKKTLSTWLKAERVPALIIKDTRLLTQKLRQHGVMLGAIEFSKQVKLRDPNKDNLVAKVSSRRVTREGRGKYTLALLDCGAKDNIVRSLVSKGVKVVTVPWNYRIFGSNLKFNALVISNGPGDPKQAQATIALVREAMLRKIPILGVCLGNQILALAAGGDTYKLKFGHRGQNQPCVLAGSEKCYLTTQNHGFAVKKTPPGFRTWFFNANDITNEGIIHKRLPFMSVQFHPEASPGPLDTAWVFDYFLNRVKKYKGNVHKSKS